MFTRCSSCRTVFHITAAELRAADGTVICGTCGTTFDALESLSETRPKDPPVTAAAPRQDEPPAPPAEDAPELDEQARDEDEFLEELESLIGSEGPGDVGDTPGEDEFLVEDLEADWVAEDSRFDQSLILDDAPEPGLDERDPEGPSVATAEDDEELDDPFLDPDSVFRIDEDVEDGDGVVAHGPAVTADETGDRRAGDEADDDQVPRAADAGGVFAWRDADRAPAEALAENDGQGPAAPVLAGTPAPGGGPAAGEADTADETGAAAAAGARAESPPEFARSAGPGRRWPRAVVALLAVFLLTGTWAHSQRGKLLRHPMGEALLVPAYGLLGIEVAPDWNPAEFRAVQWQAIADGDRPDDLTVAVEFVNMASYAQPYPVIRIVLEDRFGRRVGMHDMPPSQYLRDHSRGSRMAGGARLQTRVVVRDPGGKADGFRVDFCLELEGRGLVCGPEPFR